jgi:hypothetical protein
MLPESTIVRLTQDTIEILRQGPVSEEELADCTDEELAPSEKIGRPVKQRVNTRRKESSTLRIRCHYSNSKEDA